ncbi:MAG TPA: flagellar motor switch protein FliG [Alphaproteobacteria bacterium]|jgi:flagellar motor switch protein FliG|nr:flagellar motor switch protein FliG [Alphaproteobacteria bacterium]
MASAVKKEAYTQLRGAEKAAILMLALGEDHTAKIVSSMDDDEIKELSQAMATLGTVDAAVIERLFIEFSDMVSSTGSVVGSMESTERLLSKILPDDRVNQIMEEIRGPAGRTMWDKLGNVNEQVLANYLKNEYPQTVAVVLSKVKPDHAAAVVQLLPEGMAVEVMMRMLRMESVQREVLDDIERTLRNEFMSNVARTNRRDAHELMAEIFNNFDRATEQRFMGALEEHNREAAEKVKALMFTFEDLGRMDSASCQTLLRKIDKAKLVVALKGATEAMRDFFFANMSERGGKLLREELNDMGPVRLRDVDEAQSYMVNIAKEMAANGEIMIASDKEDELVY